MKSPYQVYRVTVRVSRIEVAEDRVTEKAVDICHLQNDVLLNCLEAQTTPPVRVYEKIDQMLSVVFKAMMRPCINAISQGLNRW